MDFKLVRDLKLLSRKRITVDNKYYIAPGYGGIGLM